MAEPASAAVRKLIVELRQRKHRREHGLFVAEGTKCVLELAETYTCRFLLARKQWIAEHPGVAATVYEATAADMERASALTTPPDVIGAFEIRERKFDPAVARREIVVALNNVQDPGNLGTIIRACDWFGVRHIVCSCDTVDCFNPKVVQATMGGLARVEISYTSLPELFRKAQAEVLGTFLDGEDINRAELPGAGFLVMGNEGNGVGREVAAMVTRRLFIPPYPAGRTHVESLNVAMATAITLAALRRKSGDQ